MVFTKIKFSLILLILFTIAAICLAETHAECNARCYRENVACCDANPDQCGQLCYEAARKCYRACNDISKTYSEINLEFLQ